MSVCSDCWYIVHDMPLARRMLLQGMDMNTAKLYTASFLL